MSSNATHWIAVAPADRFRVLVVARDAATDLLCEIRQEWEDPAHEEATFNLGKPELDLVEP